MCIYSKINKLIYKRLSILLILALALPLFGCNKSQDVALLGSPVTFYIATGVTEGSLPYDSLTYDLNGLTDRFNGIFSVEDESEISLYNTENGETVKISEDFYYVLSVFKDLYVKTQGAVNPQVKLLVDLWGFSKRYTEAGYYPIYPFDRERLNDGGFCLPNEKYITAFKNLADFSLLKIYEDKGYFVKKPQLSVTVDGVTYYSQLDLASAVKGYYLDKATEVFKKYDAKQYFLSAGGSSMYLYGKVWDLQITNPFSENREGYLSVKVENEFVSTSGTYENCYLLDGVKYSHIIDGNTGKPTESNIVSATVIGDSGILTDILSTALVNMGTEKAVDFMKTYPDYDYVLINADKSLTASVDVTYL